MKLLLLIGTTALAPLAFADTDRCQNPNLRLTCAATYNFRSSWPSQSGPKATGAINDEQPEYFDPPRCEAGVALYTPEGKFVANFAEYGMTLNAWLEFDRQPARTIFQNAQFVDGKVSATVLARLQGDIKSITFDCAIEK
jgi:hypothetical protein